MKKEWKVYIKSVPGRGNEVIKMLEDLGAKNSFDYEGNKLEALYYIWHDGSIHVELIDNEYSQIIMDNYQEIKLSEKWKDGDILINNDRTCYKVFSEYDTDIITAFFAYNISIYVNGTITDNKEGVWVCDRKNYRLATSKEKAQFYKLLHEQGKDWDAKKKQVVDWIWKPNDNEEYYHIFSDGKVRSCAWLDDEIDNSRFNIGNCFKTEEEAEIMAEKFKKLLKDKL